MRHVERSRNIFQASPVKWEGDLPTAKTEGLYVMLSAVETSEDSSTPLRSAQNDETLVGANCVRLLARGKITIEGRAAAPRHRPTKYL